jgi:ER membrane protein complex subunit 4
MMVFMLFKNPINGLMATNSAFSRFESEGTRGKILGCKLVYVVLQLVLLGLGVWKVNGMGLLP